MTRALKEVPGVKLTDGVEVRIRGRVDFYPPTGRLQLVMNGIDPVFTVGRLAADRERVLRMLAAEGLLRRNAERELGPVPLRVGLVTSGGSAAYHDFLQELAASGYALPGRPRGRAGPGRRGVAPRSRTRCAGSASSTST